MKQFLIAVDQLLNTVIGGFADESLSAHAHRKHPLMAAMIDMLFFWQDDHCRNSYQSERLRAHLPPEYRT